MVAAAGKLAISRNVLVETLVREASFEAPD